MLEQEYAADSSLAGRPAAVSTFSSIVALLVGMAIGTLLAEPSSTSSLNMCSAAQAAPTAGSLILHNGLAAARLYVLGVLTYGLLSHVLLFGFGLEAASQMVGAAKGALGLAGAASAFFPHAVPELAFFCLTSGLAAKQSRVAIGAEGALSDRLTLAFAIGRRSAMWLAILLALSGAIESQITPRVIRYVLACR